MLMLMLVLYRIRLQSRSCPQHGLVKVKRLWWYLNARASKQCCLQRNAGCQCPNRWYVATAEWQLWPLQQRLFCKDGPLIHHRCRCLGNDCAGDYHYHFPASCLETQIGNLSDGHSPQIGWALDGFPIYGPFGPGGTVMSHTEQGCSGTYCLDGCSGLEMELPGVDQFKYRYYMIH